MSPRITHPTSSSSRLSAMPMAPPGNWTISLYITSESPSIFATPSATVRMLPVFFLTALVESRAICCSICSRTVLIGRERWKKRYRKRLDSGGESGELTGDGGLVDIIADADAETGEQRIVASCDAGNPATVLRRHGSSDFRQHRIVHRTGMLDERLLPRHLSGDQPMIGF